MASEDSSGAAVVTSSGMHTRAASADEVTFQVDVGSEQLAPELQPGSAVAPPPRIQAKSHSTPTDNQLVFKRHRDSSGHLARWRAAKSAIVHDKPVASQELDAVLEQRRAAQVDFASAAENVLASQTTMMDEREDFERQNREQQLSLAERIVGHLKWGAHETATEEERGDSWRSKLAEAMEDHRCQLVILGLLVLDLMFTFGELLLHHACNEGEVHAHDEHGDPSTVEIHTVHDVSHVLHIASLAILSIFLAQQVALIVGLGPGLYVRHFWYIVDFVVIVAALVLETRGGGWIVAVMAWRGVRILHGFVMAELETHKQVIEARHDHSMRIIAYEELLKEQAMAAGAAQEAEIKQVAGDRAFDVGVAPAAASTQHATPHGALASSHATSEHTPGLEAV